jgi:deoxyribodipyrimidine photo-lyase
VSYRRLKSRQYWDKRWEVMRAEPKVLDEKLKVVKLDPGENLLWNNNQIQTFNREASIGLLDSFVKERYVNYSKHTYQNPL